MTPGGRRRICAAKADVLPDETGFAAIAGGDPHGIDWGCAETAIAHSGRNSRGFIDGLPETAIVGLTTIMERREVAKKAEAPHSLSTL
jgi:hypothetical protein